MEKDYIGFFIGTRHTI